MTLSETTTIDGTAEESRGRDERSAADDSRVVGIGASADGLEALERFFAALPDEPGMAFIVVQHLDPEYESNLGEILQRQTSLPVETAEDGCVLERDRVYVGGAGDEVRVEDGMLRVKPLSELDGKRHTLDLLFRSLSEVCGYRSVGILFSGAGTDGTVGLRAIKERGGLTMVQDPDEAGSPYMPQHAIDAGVADFVLPIDELVDRLLEVTEDPRVLRSTYGAEELDEDREELLEGVLALLRERHDCDLDGFKRSTLLRRVERRMEVLRIERLDEYLRYLRNHEKETRELFSELTITVTRFFRDREVWERLAAEVIPRLFEGKSGDDELRVWVPGCATGEEAYTVAMLLAREAERLDDPPKIKIFATDLDAAAIETAREARYSRGDLTDLPEEFVGRYFEEDDDGLRLEPTIRKRVLFATHDVLNDPPFSDLDFVSCRNLLIYLTDEAQDRLLHLLHYGIREGGYLLLGTSEIVVQGGELFEHLEEGLPMYRALGDRDRSVRIPGRPFGFETFEIDPIETAFKAESTFDAGEYHRSSLLEAHVPASLLVDEDGALLHSVGDVDRYLTIPGGEPTRNAFEMMSEEMRPRVRTLISEAMRSDGETIVRRMPPTVSSSEGRTALFARRLDPDDRDRPVVELTFRIEEGEFGGLTESSAPSAAERGEETLVEQLERELAQVRERLRETIDRHKATTNRLRTSNEELVSMNEELQSAAEELETSREELRSTNDELTAVNEELNEKIRELDAVNNDLKNLLRSTEIGTIFLDRDLTVERYTEPVCAYVNVVEEDVGRPFDHLTHQLDADDLMEDARTVLRELTTIEREVSTEDGGRHLLFRALPYLTVDDKVDGVVMTFVDITERKRMQEQLAASEMKFRTVFESAADPIFVYEIEGGDEPSSFVEVNSRAVEMTGFTRDELDGLTICQALGGEEFECEEHLRGLVRNREVTGEALLRTAGRAEPIPCEFSARRMELGGTHIVVEVVRDITDRKRYEQALLESRERAEELAELRSMFLSTLSHDVRSPLTGILAMTHVLDKKLEGAELEFLERIENSAKQLRKILDSILRMASVETNKAVASPESFELVEHIREVLEIHVARADRSGLELDYEPPEKPCEVRLDPQFVTQIVNNLVENAIKYTEEGGIHVRLAECSDEVEIEVVDTGVGIPEEEREAIFERFQTSHRHEMNQDSIGLGLAITELLVDSMDGEITLESLPDRGSCFTVRLPRELEGETQCLLGARFGGGS